MSTRQIEFEDIKEIIRYRKLKKYKQYHGQEKKTKNGRQNDTQKTKD